MERLLHRMQRRPRQTFDRGYGRAFEGGRQNRAALHRQPVDETTQARVGGVATDVGAGEGQSRSAEIGRSSCGAASTETGLPLRVKLRSMQVVLQWLIIQGRLEVLAAIGARAVVWLTALAQPHRPMPVSPARGLWLVRTALVDGVRPALRAIHNAGWQQQHPMCFNPTRAGLGLPRLRHRPSARSPAPAFTQIFIDRHAWVSLHLSADMGMSTPPWIAFTGPAALGLMSNSKICVGSHKVAQALGMSTTPLMCPCTGAVPRMA